MGTLAAILAIARIIQYVGPVVLTLLGDLIKWHQSGNAQLSDQLLAQVHAAFQQAELEEDEINMLMAQTTQQAEAALSVKPSA